MTSPSTSEIRSWARENGFSPAERGRLNPEILEAFAAANGGSSSPSPAKKVGAGKPAAKKAPAKKAAGKKAAKKAPAKKVALGKTATAPAVKSAPAKATPAVKTAAQSKAVPAEPVPTKTVAPVTTPAPASLETAVAELKREVASLTNRLDRLELTSGARPSRFRRRR